MLIKPRPPIVTILGHVDHGKTTLLDFIRKTQLASHEAGGITQTIGAYQVKIKAQNLKLKTDGGEKAITFIDTPGHEAFATLRARGGRVADLVILVVAADDGVKPQTIEAIHHIRSVNVPFVVAINKIDLIDANPERVKEQLAKEGVLVEGWGGDVVSVLIAAKTGKNVDDLLEMVWLVAEMQDLKVDWETNPSGVVIESSLDEKRGPLVTLIVLEGVLKVGQLIISGQSFGKIRAMFNWKGNSLKTAEPSTPVQVLGFKNLARAGEKFSVVKSLPTVSKIQDKVVVSLGRTQGLEDLRIPLIIKADSQGSLEAVRYSLENLKRKKAVIDFVHEGIGEITSTDVMMAVSFAAAIYGFRVGADRGALEAAKVEGVEIRTEEIIYRLIEALEDLIKQKETPVSMKIAARAKILKVFTLSDGTRIAGCRIEEGKLSKGAKSQLRRDDKVLGEAKIVSLKIGKELKDKVEKGDETGIAFDQRVEFSEGDWVEVFSA